MRESVSIFRTLDLPGGSLLPFTSVPGERVRILYGRVWLTEEGIARDAFLASGDEVSLDSRGLAVIEALGPARVQLAREGGVAPSFDARRPPGTRSRVIQAAARWSSRRHNSVVGSAWFIV